MKRNLKYGAVLVISAPIIHILSLGLVAVMIYNDRKRDERMAGK